MIFLMMAAHDTTTSALSSLVHLLLENPAWQERVRAEILARGPAPLGWDDRGSFPLLDRCFDETLGLFLRCHMLRECRCVNARWLASRFRRTCTSRQQRS